MRTKFLLLVSIMGLASCGGSGAGLDENGRPLTGEPTPLVPELQSIQQNIFTPICAACHAGSSAPLGLRLDEGFAYSMLVNTASVEVPALLRISPGNPDQSYLIQKLEGHAAVGGQMPLGQSPLPQATIDVIRQWITNGAQASVAAATVRSVSAAQMRATMPLDGDQLAQPPREILVQAEGEIDVASLLAAGISLRRSGGDGTFHDGNEINLDGVSISVHSLQPTVLALSLPAEQWVPDAYELAFSDTFILQFTVINGGAQ
jgi:hypothetical protein